MPTVYLETTIPSYLAARPSRDLIIAAHQQITHEWWREARHRFDVYISEAVLAEIRAGDPDAAARRLAIVDGLPILALNDDVRGLVHTWPSPSPMPWIIWSPGIVPTLPMGRLFVGSNSSAPRGECSVATCYPYHCHSRRTLRISD